MKEILTIAMNTGKGILKMKVVYFLIICVWILVGCMYRYDVISLERHRELMLDMALLLNQIAAILTVLSLTFDIPRELREGIAATYLTKSLGRTKYLIGKAIGVCFVAVIVCTLVSVGSYGIYASCFPEPVLLIYCKIQLLILLSSIPMAALCTFCAVTLPEMAAPFLAILLIWFLAMTRKIAIPVVNGALLPDLDLFNLKEHVIYQVMIPWSYIGGVLLYGLCVAVFFLVLSGMILQMRDIK